MTASQQAFNRDLSALNAKFEELNAVGTDDDGFQYIDADMVPARLLDTYNHLLQYGYANGLLP